VLCFCLSFCLYGIINYKAVHLYCRWTYGDFFKRYKVLAVSKDVEKTNIRRTCENIISKLVQVSAKFHFVHYSAYYILLNEINHCKSTFAYSFH